MYLHLRQPVEATRACQHTLAIHPESLEAQACLERAYVQRGMYGAALRAARATAPNAPHSGQLSASTGSDVEAARALTALWRSRLERLENVRKTRWISPYTLATTFVMVGDTQRALDHLEAAADERVGMLAFLNRDPAIDPLRQEPRFQALIARLDKSER